MITTSMATTAAANDGGHCDHEGHGADCGRHGHDCGNGADDDDDDGGHGDGGELC